MHVHSFGINLLNSYEFCGAKEMPFLAPRGIYVHGDTLIVSDTGHNRVFIWNKIPQTTFKNPDIILGQSEVELTSRNAGDKLSAQSLLYPSGVWTNGEIIILADAWNHRVLIWHSIPKKNGQKADVVIGQPDFYSNTPNIKGISADPTAKSLYWPYGVYSDGHQLWIADTGNRRVLHFNTIPKDSYLPADNVIGKPNFTERDYQSENAVWPYSVKIHHTGQMVISDTQFFRTLYWHNWRDALHQKADIIIGQNKFNECGQNQFRLAPTDFTMNWTYDACFYKDGILVNDTGNSRILGFNKTPIQNNASADWLIGRPNFSTSSEFSDNLTNLKNAIYWPFSICTQENYLYIADTGNHRIIIGQINHE